MLNPLTMEELLQLPRETWALRNGDLLSLDSWNGRPEEIARHRDLLLVVLHGIPDFVWQDHEGRPEPGSWRSGSAGRADSTRGGAS